MEGVRVVIFLGDIWNRAEQHFIHFAEAVRQAFGWRCIDAEVIPVGIAPDVAIAFHQLKDVYGELFSFTVRFPIGSEEDRADFVQTDITHGDGCAFVFEQVIDRIFCF